jgi:hypothetical protein
LDKWFISKLEQKNCKMNLEYLILESKEKAQENNRGMIKGHRNQLEDFLMVKI